MRRTDFAALAIARYGDSSEVYLCDQHWEVITDGLYYDVADAIRQAEFEFRGVRFRDT